MKGSGTYWRKAERDERRAAKRMERQQRRAQKRDNAGGHPPTADALYGAPCCQETASDAGAVR